MRSFFLEIYQYQTEINQKLIELLFQHQDVVTDRILLLFSHSLNAHQIWNARLLDEKQFKVTERHPLDEFLVLDELNYRKSVGIINTFEFDNVCFYHNSKGQHFQRDVKDILFHVSNHWTHHRAQIMTLLRELDISPFPSDFIFYKR